MSKIKIINFLVALKHEALPIIDYFELTLNELIFLSISIFVNVIYKIYLIQLFQEVQNLPN